MCTCAFRIARFIILKNPAVLTALDNLSKAMYHFPNRCIVWTVARLTQYNQALATVQSGGKLL